MDTNDSSISMTDALKLRNTETSALKRMPPTNATSSASSAARKTIKLKPLTPQVTDSSAGNEPSPESIPLVKKVGVPAANPGEENAAPPQFMSTATAPVAKIPRPESAAAPLGGVAPVKVASPAPSASPAVPKGGTGTVSIPKINLKPKTVTVAPVSAAAPAAPAAASATMFAEKYECDAAYVSGLVVASTIISVATMPLIMLLYGAIV